MDANTKVPGRLALVASPIGNLGDITHRALAVLKEADTVACEDTRHSARLLSHYGIRAPRLVSLHAHNEAARSGELVKDLREGSVVAYLSDAGTPAISDPGGRLVQACLRAGIPYEVIPGPSAVITAVAGSGLVDTAFYFGGFLPNKSGQRENRLREALGRKEASVFFESPHRISRSLDVLAEIGPERGVCVARELTKIHEEFARGTAENVAAMFRDRTVKGEITLVVAGTDLPKWIDV